MPAGSAKKEMPKRAQTQAITFPFQVTGTASIIKVQRRKIDFLHQKVLKGD